MKRKSQVVVDVRSISQSPRRLRAKYTHRTKLRFMLKGISPCRELNAGYGNAFVNGCLSIHLQKYGRIYFAEEKGESAYRKKFIYSIDEIK